VRELDRLLREILFKIFAKLSKAETDHILQFKATRQELLIDEILS